MSCKEIIGEGKDLSVTCKRSEGLLYANMKGKLFFSKSEGIAYEKNKFWEGQGKQK